MIKLQHVFLSVLFVLVSAFSLADSLASNSVIIHGPDQESVFNVEIAADDTSRAIGLMHRESLDLDKGMLFVYEHPKVINMWMKDTLISLDMIFINENLEVIRIAPHTKPLSTAVISSENPAKYVLEINAGLSRRYGINVGNKVTLPASH